MQNLSKEKKIAKIIAIISTTIYTLVFPFFLLLALMSAMVFDSPNMTLFLGLWLMSLVFCLPLSIPITIFLLWRAVRRKEYRKTYKIWAFPLITFALVYIITYNF